MNSSNKLASIFKLLNSPRKVFIGCCGFLLGFGLILALSQNLQLIISETDSHPKHYFLHFPHIKANLNDFVILNSDWYGKKIIKQIVGLDGDRIWYDAEQCLWINDKRIGYLKSKSKDSRLLTPLEAQIIPKGYVFVHSDHESSFDSRYQELGLIPISSLEGKVLPLI